MARVDLIDSKVTQRIGWKFGKGTKEVERFRRRVGGDESARTFPEKRQVVPPSLSLPSLSLRLFVSSTFSRSNESSPRT